MEILHTTGIHKQVGDPKKVRKQGSTFCPPKKVRSEGSPFSPPFFQSWKKTGNTKMIACRYKTYIRHIGEETKNKEKVSCKASGFSSLFSFSLPIRPM
jgi:hypothetical protein